MKRWVLSLAALAVSTGLGFGLGYSRGSASITSDEQAAIEEAFADSMEGVVLEGSFTIDGVERPPSTERYTIDRVEKAAGDIWLFHSRIEYGDTDVSLPVPVKVLWAGDTPVVTLTDAALPGLGTFTVRLVFYRGRYAGLWSSPETGGFQFGSLTDATN